MTCILNKILVFFLFLRIWIFKHWLQVSSVFPICSCVFLICVIIVRIFLRSACNFLSSFSCLASIVVKRSASPSARWELVKRTENYILLTIKELNGWIGGRQVFQGNDYVFMFWTLHHSSNLLIGGFEKRFEKLCLYQPRWTFCPRRSCSSSASSSCIDATLRCHSFLYTLCLASLAFACMLFGGKNKKAFAEGCR